MFFPNMKTGMDDQLARCKVAVGEGLECGRNKDKEEYSFINCRVQSLNPDDNIIRDEITGMDWVESITLMTHQVAFQPV